jgi:hypothetical protein
MNDHSHSRRGLLKIACTALAAIPVLSIAGNAFAATNATMRKALNYQDSPKDGKSCSVCLNFVPGATSASPGHCKIIGGDDEIVPNGYCVGFVVKK